MASQTLHLLFVQPTLTDLIFRTYSQANLATFRASSRPLWFRRQGKGSTERIDGIRVGRFVSRSNAELSVGTNGRGGDVAGEDERRPSFSIDLAVLLAGFAFEAYRTPADNIGRCETDAAGCKTMYLSESFFCDLYRGQLFIKLKKGLQLPAMNLWGTSDPYVVMRLDDQVVQSKIKWGSKEPSWNEEFILYTSEPSKKRLEVAAWDANLLTPHKRMGNTSITLEELCDGKYHELLIELEGMGGGGKLQLEVKYQTFEDMENENKWWKFPFITELLQTSKFHPLIKMAIGSESISASDFVEKAFGHFKQLSDSVELFGDSQLRQISELGGGYKKNNDEKNSGQVDINFQDDSAVVSERQYWSRFADYLSQMVFQNLPIPELKWEGFELLNKLHEQLQQNAETNYIKLGLAIPKSEDSVSETDSDVKTKITVSNSVLQAEQISRDLLRQVDFVFGALMAVTQSLPKLDKGLIATKLNSQNQNCIKPSKTSALDDIKSMEMKKLFSTAESAMEAWAMLATSVGHSSFIKSEFEKICFLDNEGTDTQVAIWRDIARRRIIISFRGTEQSKWKDLRTDLMLIPAGMNPERIGGDSKNEMQVHSGFLGAYDSVRIRILSIIKQIVNQMDEIDMPQKWHVHVTGHSLGGALATLLALDLSSSLMYRNGVISVTMYNFGSPRVGNQRFSEVYNQKMKDSWRVVNRRDIVPTVPRLMGYCHVAEPIYLAPGALSDALKNRVEITDSFEDDVIGEYTPDILLNEFMKGEKELIKKILDTEIKLLSSIRDGSALMQHMEDFYYVALLENVRLFYGDALQE